MTSTEILEALSYNSSPNKPKRVGWMGIALAGATGGAAVLLSVIAAPFVVPALRKVCLPYVPASSEQVKNVLQALQSSRGKTLLDLGSGDGRLVIAASKAYPLLSTGVELNPWLVMYSKYKAWTEGVHSTTDFLRKDLYTLNLKKFDNVVLFGVEEMMADMEEKFSKELPSHGHAIVCRFPLPSWEPVRTYGAGIDTVWVYKKPCVLNI